jgi:hypothetical protein
MQAGIFPEARNGDLELIHSAENLRVHGEHELVAFKLYEFRIDWIELVIFEAQPVRTLYGLRLSVYNLRCVISSKECTRCFVDVSFWIRPTLPTKE